MPYFPDTINITSRNCQIEACFSRFGDYVNISNFKFKGYVSGNFGPISQDDLVKVLSAYLDRVEEAVNKLAETSLEEQSMPLSTVAVLDQSSHEGSFPDVPQAYHIHHQVLAEIEKTIGHPRPEQGGMLGGSRKDRLVTHFHFDVGGDTSGGTYSPDTVTLNRVVQEWNEQNIDLVGFVHSHPGNFIHPSSGDERYAKAFFRACQGMDAFFMPIVRTIGNGGYLMKGFVVERHPSGNHRLSPVDYHPY